jgi:hypothetical protein
MIERTGRGLSKFRFSRIVNGHVEPDRDERGAIATALGRRSFPGARRATTASPEPETVNV